MDSQKNRTAVIKAARSLRDAWRDGTALAPPAWELNDALTMLDRTERVSEFQAGMRRRRIELCQREGCWMRADHSGVHCLPNDAGRCTYAEDGMRCVMYGDERIHTDHLVDDRCR